MTYEVTRHPRGDRTVLLGKTHTYTRTHYTHMKKYLKRRFMGEEGWR